MECELAAGADDLVDSKPSELDLQIHTVHLGDGPVMDNSAEGTSKLKLVLLASGHRGGQTSCTLVGGSPLLCRRV